MSRPRVTTRWTPELDGRDLVALAPDPTAVMWLGPHEQLVGWGEALVVQPRPGADRFAEAEAGFRAWVDAADVDDAVAVPGSGPVAVGTFAFDDRATGSLLQVPRLLLGRRDGRTWCTRVTEPGGPPIAEPGSGPSPVVRSDRVRYAGSSQPDVRWLAAVAEAVDRIEAGELEKVVLARDHAVWSHEAFDPRDLVTRLHRRFPGCMTFHVDGLLGASPELLTRVHGDDVTSRVLAGTTASSDDADRDAALGAALLGSDKDGREHRFAADSAADALAPLVATLDRRGPELLRLDNVQHLATSLAGTLTAARSALDVVAALHPTAAVGGTPRRTALRLVRQLEGMERGRYCGPVGWTDRRGDGSWAIALRCAEVSGARARLFAGAGIVAGSLPEDELEETRLKLRAMQSALT